MARHEKLFYETSHPEARRAEGSRSFALLRMIQKLDWTVCHISYLHASLDLKPSKK